MGTFLLICRCRRWLCYHLVIALVVATMIPKGNEAVASVNLPLHHWTYEAIERLVALGVIDHAMVIPKPYSRKQAAKYVAQAIERIRADQVPQDGPEVVAEPLLARLIEFLRPELGDLDVIRQRFKQNS